MTLRKKMKIKPVLFGSAIALFFVIFAGLVFLPAVLSSDMLKPRLLQQINRHLPGQLQVEQWRFKWFSGIEANGITYEDRQQNLLVKIAALRGYRGLIQLIANPRNLGGIEVVEPEIVFFLQDKHRKEPSDRVASSQASGPPVFSGVLKITDGSIRAATPDRVEKTVVRDLDLFLDISDIQKPIVYRVFLISGDRLGRFSGEGTMTLSANDPFNLSRIQSDARLKITNWELEDALSILASRGDFPSGKGRLDADLALQGSAAEDLDIKGNLSLDRLELQGGPLGADHPLIKGIGAQIDATITGDILTLKQLSFQSSLANGAARGTFAGQGQKQLQSSAEIDLAQVFSQLPHTLNLRRDTTLSEGKLKLSAGLKTINTVTAFDGNARVDSLKGVSSGKKIAWNQPIAVKARGQMRPEGIWLDALSLRSSFMNADGQGDLGHLQATLSADLASALRELKKFININEWDGSGQLFAKLQFKETSPDRDRGSLNLEIRHLALSRNGHVIFPQQDLKADLTTTLHQGKNLSASEFQQPNLTLQSPMVRGNFTAASFKFNSTGNLPAADNLSIDGSFNLQQISALLQNFNKLSKTTQMAGTAHIQTSGSLHEQTLVLNSTRIETRNFRYRNENKAIHEDRFILETKGNLNFKKKSAFFAPVEISASPGTLIVPELAVNDWSNFQKDTKTRAKANFDLAKLAEGYGDFIQLPENTRVRGKGQFDFELDFSSPQAQFLKVDADFAPFQLTSDTLPSISEDHVKLRADLKRSPDGKSLTIENIQLNSTPLSLSAAGDLEQTGQSQTLAASGNINFDLKMLSPYLQEIAGSPVTISGKGDNPFKLKIVAGTNRWADSLKQTDFSGAIRADAIDAFGVNISKTEVPIRVANASAVAKLDATANGGQLNLQPTIDLRKAPYVLSLPQNSQILKSVEITDAVADKLLSKIHPVFRGSVQAEGFVDLFMQHFNWPLDKQSRDKATFAGTLHLKGVRIKSTNLLTELLGLIGIHGNEMDFGDLDIDFVARNGRIETSPIRLEIDGYPIELNGSVGFDKSLDYTAKLPITPMLVGNKAYRYLEGATIDVPIGGSSSNPDIDKRAMQKATADMAQQVLQKSLEQGVQNIFEQLIKKK
jgi:hypothetical protein